MEQYLVGELAEVKFLIGDFCVYGQIIKNGVSLLLLHFPTVEKSNIRNHFGDICLEVMQSFNYFEPLNCNHDNYVGLLQVSLFISGTHLWFSGAKSENYFPPFLE